MSAQNSKESNILSVIDFATGQKVGGVKADWNHFFKDAWEIVDANDNPICNLSEASNGRAILSELSNGLIAQRMNFRIGDDVVGELRQKAVLIGHQLLVDFSQDAARRLDRRLGLAAAIMVADHQATTQDD